MTQELVKLFRIRDFLFGDNGRPKNIPFALSLAKNCKHEEAEWLLRILPSDKMEDPEATTILMEQQVEDHRAVYYACLMGTGNDSNKEVRETAAKAGCTYAQARMCLMDDRENWFMEAMKNNEPIAFVEYGISLSLKDIKSSIPYFEKAAKLGRGSGQYYYGMYGFTDKDAERFYWLGKSIIEHDNLYAKQHFFRILEEEELKSRVVAFEIGHALSVGNITSDYIFGYRPASRLTRKKAIAATCIYEGYIKKVKGAVIAWVLVCRRLKIYKDVRFFIGKLIWKSVIEWVK